MIRVTRSIIVRTFLMQKEDIFVEITQNNSFVFQNQTLDDLIKLSQDSFFYIFSENDHLFKILKVKELSGQVCTKLCVPMLILRPKFQ